MRAVRGLVVVALTVGLVACGGSEDKDDTATPAARGTSASDAAAPAETPADTPAGEPVLKGSFTLTKPTAKSGDFIDTIGGASTCQDVASKGNGGGGFGPEGSFQVPGPSLTDPLSDQFRVTVEVREYVGPGDYSGKMTGSIQVDKGAFYSVADADAKTTLTIKDDGSGEFTFVGAKDSAAGGTADGSITWTCTSP